MKTNLKPITAKTMKNKFTLLRRIAFKMLLGCLSFSLLIGCASTPPKPAIVANGVIKNPTIGFKGYELAIPSGYEIFDPAQNGTADSPLITALKKDFCDEILRRDTTDENFEFAEIFLLTDRESALLFAATTGRIPYTFSQIPDDRKREFLQRVAIHIFERKVGASIKKVVRVGDRYAINIQWQEQFTPSDPNRTPLQANAYMVLGDLNEIFIFAGVTQKENASRLTPILNQMVRDLKF